MLYCVICECNPCDCNDFFGGTIGQTKYIHRIQGGEPTDRESDPNVHVQTRSQEGPSNSYRDPIGESRSTQRERPTYQQTKTNERQTDSGCSSSCCNSNSKPQTQKDSISNDGENSSKGHDRPISFQSEKDNQAETKTKQETII